MRLILSLFYTFCVVYAKHEMYDGHALLNLKIKDVDQMNLLNSLKVSLKLNVLKYAAPGREAEVLVSKEQKQNLLDELFGNGVEFEIKTENIKESLDLEDKLNQEAIRKNPQRCGSIGQIGFDRIYNYTEVDAYLDAIAVSYPDVVTLVNAGKTFEGRDLKYLKISTTKFQDTSKPIVFVQSLLHAREWVTLPPTLWAIDKLVVNVTEPDLIDNMDWIILPIANPDGYDFSHAEMRFWRANRATGFEPSDCIGVDLNRNFDIMWADFSSSNPCRDDFHGLFPNSELETKIIIKIFEEYKNRIGLYIDLHSPGQEIIYGWGNGILLPNAFSLHQVGLNMGKAMDKAKLESNKNFTVGNVALLLYALSGSGMDYANKVGIPYSYAFELIGTDGVLVDPNDVEQIAIETWEGIKVGARNVRDILVNKLET